MIKFYVITRQNERQTRQNGKWRMSYGVRMLNGEWCMLYAVLHVDWHKTTTVMSSVCCSMAKILLGQINILQTLALLMASQANPSGHTAIHPSIHRTIQPFIQPIVHIYWATHSSCLNPAIYMCVCMYVDVCINIQTIIR